MTAQSIGRLTHRQCRATDFDVYQNANRSLETGLVQILGRPKTPD